MKMKAKTITFLITFIVINIGKTQKQELFYNQFGKEISKKKQSKIAQKKFKKFTIGIKETESVIEKKLFLRYQHNTLNEKNKNILIEFIESLIAHQIPDNYITIIMFYQGIDQCNSTGSSDPEFFRRMYNDFKIKILEEGEIIQFNIYKTNEGMDKYTKDRIWYKDENQVIENLFFDYQYPCGGYVVFDMNGNYIKYLGEYHPDMSIDDVKKLKKIR